MNKAMEKLLKGKREMREKLGNLPFGKKLAMVEKMRDRSLLLASNPLRRPIISVSGDGVGSSAIGANTERLKPPVFRRSPGQSNIRQNSVSVVASLSKRTEQWNLEHLGESGCQSEPPEQA